MVRSKDSLLFSDFAGPRDIPVTHVFSVAFEDLPKYIDELVILCETPILLDLECLVGLSHENGV